MQDISENCLWRINAMLGNENKNIFHIYCFSRNERMHIFLLFLGENSRMKGRKKNKAKRLDKFLVH